MRDRSSSLSSLQRSVSVCHMHLGSQLPARTAEHDQGTLNHDHLPTTMRFRSFRLPGRHGTRVHAVAKARDPASGDELTQAERRALQSRPDNHDRATDEDGLASTEEVTEPDCCDGAEETS